MCEPGFSTATWLDDCQQMYDELYNMDSESMSDVEFTKTLLNNMPIDSNWRNFLSGLRQEYSKRTVHPGSIEVINTICDEYWIQNRNDPQSYGTAFSAKLNVQSAKRRIGDDGRGALGDNKRAHTQGTDQQPWKDKNKLRCTVKDCESPTRHEAPDCFVYEGGKQGQYPHWYRGPRDIHLPKAQREPRKTKPRVSQADALQTSQTPQPLSVAPISTDSIDLNSVSENNVWSLHTNTVEDELPDVVVCSMPITDSNIPCSDACYHDSGANRHVFHNHDIFSDYECIKPITVQAFGKGLTTQAIGRGCITLKGWYGDQFNYYKLTNCLHIPDSRINLISQRRLDQFGVVGQLSAGGPVLVRNGTPIIGGMIHNDLYRLNLVPVNTDAPDEVITLALKSAQKNPDFCTA